MDNPPPTPTLILNKETKNYLYKRNSHKISIKKRLSTTKWTNGQPDGQLYVQKKMS